jgi:hypothetical protein
VSLTAKKSLRLQDAGLVKLYEDHHAVWAAMAKEAYDYTADFVKDAGEPVRPDDLIPVLEPVLEVTKILRAYLSENHLSQKYWFTWFGELIIEHEWSDLSSSSEEEPK